MNIYLYYILCFKLFIYYVYFVCFVFLYIWHIWKQLFFSRACLRELRAASSQAYLRACLREPVYEPWRDGVARFDAPSTETCFRRHVRKLVRKHTRQHVRNIHLLNIRYCNIYIIMYIMYLASPQIFICFFLFLDF